MDESLPRRRRSLASQLEGMSLFNQPSESDIERDVERLTTLAGELALKAGRHGCTVSDLRLFAVARGVLTGDESPARIKRLNLGAIMRSAGLVRTDTYRRSSVPKSHGNIHSVWTIKEFAEVA